MAAAAWLDLTGFAKWVAASQWRPRLTEVMDEHFGQATAALGIGFEEIDDVLDGNWTVTLWHCAVEDLATRRFGADSLTSVETYLRDRRCRESREGRAGLLALGNSTASLYTVSDIAPAGSLLARDMIRGGPPILVRGVAPLRALETAEPIAARLLTLEHAAEMARGILPFSTGAARRLCRQLRGPGHHPDAGPDEAGNEAMNRGQPPAAYAVVQPLAPLLTRAWLADRLPQAF